MAGLDLGAALRRIPWPVVAGLVALYAPVYLQMGHRQGLDDGIAPPLIAAAAAWLAWRAWPALRALEAEPARLAGALSFSFGLILYVLGRIVDFPAADVGSQIPVLTGLVLLFYGWRGFSVLAFPLLFLVFMVPLPGAVVVELTAPLRLWGAKLSTAFLGLAGYPVALNGTIVSIGRYMLLVNEACSGLGSMFSLAAAGLLYVHLAGARCRLHLALLLAAILPVAFFANVLRILALALITFHVGDRFAQGPAHDMAGVLIFGVALGMLFAVDSLLRRWLPGQRP